MTVVQSKFGQAATKPGAAARASRLLGQAATFWYVTAVAGQILFVAFILLFYYPATLSDRFADWNRKPLIDGFINGDTAGNLFFAFHVMLAAGMMFGGILQIPSSVRQRWPRFHRWNGRAYMVSVLALALSGLWLVWVRGTWMNLTGAVGISLNAAVVIGCAAMAWRSARQQRFAAHRKWAIRLFLAASAVWFMRIGYMMWGIASGGVGIGDRMDGPFDYFLAFANTLVPLGILELYFLVQAKGKNIPHYLMATLLLLCGAATIGGSIGAWLVMWGPYV